MIASKIDDDVLKRELDLCREMMVDDGDELKFMLLYAAQRALAWAADPRMAAAPVATILRGGVQPRGIAEDARDYLVDLRQPLSSSTCGHSGSLPQ